MRPASAPNAMCDGRQWLGAERGADGRAVDGRAVEEVGVISPVRGIRIPWLNEPHPQSRRRVGGPTPTGSDTRVAIRTRGRPAPTRPCAESRSPVPDSPASRTCRGPTPCTWPKSGNTESSRAVAVAGPRSVIGAGGPAPIRGRDGWSLCGWSPRSNAPTNENYHARSGHTACRTPHAKSPRSLRPSEGPGLPAPRKGGRWPVGGARVRRWGEVRALPLPGNRCRRESR